jgi:SnoaL-like domain
VSEASTALDVAQVQELVARWWFHYDQGDFDELTKLLTDDVHFSCRTDTGATDYEDFVRADLRGRDAVMAWQRRHRLDSPYPLRHHGTNVHITERSGDQVAFASYLFVTQILGGVANLSTAIVRGTARRDDAGSRIAEFEVVLDTMESRPLRELQVER